LRAIQIIILFIVSSSCNFIFAQNILDSQVDLIQLENATWYIQESNWNAEEFTVSAKDYFQLSTKLGKIDATTNIYYKINSTLSIDLNGKPTKQFMVRQDSTNGKVYARSFMDDKKEYLLYDFNMNVGDTINSLLTLNLSQKLIVTKISTITINETSRKQITAHIEGDTERRSFKFIEGVGSAYGFIVDLNSQRENITVLKCYSSIQKPIYTNGACKTAPTTRQRPAREPKTIIESN
jgi:hypothetical protein